MRLATFFLVAFVATSLPSSGTLSNPANPAQVEKAKENPKLKGWFVGQVMKATSGKANPQAVNDVLRKQLLS